MDSKLKAVFITIVTLLGATVLLIVYSLNQGQAVKPAGTISSDAANGANSDKMQTEGSLSGGIYQQYGLNPDKDPYAFLRDDSFFETPKEEVDQSRVLSLQVSTVYKDLRIYVVDGYGAPVKESGVKITLSYLDAPKVQNEETKKEAEDLSGKNPEDNLEKNAEKNPGNNLEKNAENNPQKKSETGEDEDRKESVSQNDVPQGKEYQDADVDGMIYVSNLSSGQYSIRLLPVEGYEVPTEDLTAKVSDEITYTVLKDISFLIKSEDEIDAKQEDTEVNSAEIEADGTETNVLLNDGASVFGIDVSKWNKEIDWKKAKAAGVEFAIIRCGYRGSKTGALVEDPYFKQNIQGALDADVRVGLYFFTQAVNEVEAVEEASMVLSLCRNYKISYPLFIDTEGAGGHGRADGLSKEMRTSVCKAFCETIENAGFTGGVYASKSWLNNNLEMKELAGYETWLAQYSKEATYEGEYDMWQYTSAGRIDGINTLVDFDVSYRDF